MTALRQAVDEVVRDCGGGGGDGGRTKERTRAEG